MKIIVAGGSGLVGTKLLPQLHAQGHEIVLLTTQKKLQHPYCTVSYWDPRNGIIDSRLLVGADAVINLAGYTISAKWTDENKDKMVESRLESTATLVKAFADSNKNVGVWIGASASGYYVPGQDLRKENDAPAADFLGQLTSSWEKQNYKILPKADRVVLMRLSVILDKNGGALAKMAPIYRAGFGAPLGDGQQMMSWIHIDDVVSFICFALENRRVKDIYNLASPEVIPQKTFSKALAKALHRPHFLPPVPRFVIRLIFGEMAQLVLEGRHLCSDKIQQSGFRFKYAHIDSALAHLYAHSDE
jgi:uncharacterized protein